MRTVTIITPKLFVGSAMPCSVLIDDGEYAVIRNGENKTFEIPEGSHRMQLVARPAQGWSIYKSDVVFINEIDGNMSYKIKIKMGFALKLFLEKV